MAAIMIPRSRHLKFVFVISVIFFSNPIVRGSPHASGSQQNVSHNTRLERCQSTYKNLTKEKLERFIDASGNTGSGIYGGNTLWYGSYSECKQLTDSRYCLTEFKGTISMVGNETKIYDIQWGVCMPDVCTDKDVLENFQFFFKNVSNNKRVTPFLKTLTVNCAEDYEYTASVIITILICVLLALTCLLATIVDRVKMQNKEEIVDDSNIPLDKVAEEKTSLLTKETIKRVDENSTFNEVLRSFSIVRNINSIMNTDVGNRDLTCLHGIRVLSLFWVILFHVNCLVTEDWPLNNLDDVVKFEQRWQTILPQTAYAVDTFFLLSGLLLMYTNINKTEKNDGKTNWFKYYAHRYLRLTPTLMFCVLLVAMLLPFFGAGPVWMLYISADTTACSENWWTNLLYVNNFVESDKRCISPTWYLSADMQMFLISPIYLVIAYRYGLRPLLYAVGTTILGSIIITVSIIFANDYPPVGQDAPRIKFYDAKGAMEALRNVYEKTYCRVAVYVIGIILGYVLHKYSKQSFNFSPKTVTVLWTFAALLALTDVYVLYTATKKDPYVWTTAESALYWSLKWPIWGLCVFWLIFACHYNYAGLVKEILEARFWIPLSRVNYSAYIIHKEVLKILIYNIETPIHFTAFTMTTYYLSTLMLAYAVAFIINVMVELPCANIESIIWKRLEKNKGFSVDPFFLYMNIHLKGAGCLIF